MLNKCQLTLIGSLFLNQWKYPRGFTQCPGHLKCSVMSVFLHLNLTSCPSFAKTWRSPMGLAVVLSLLQTLVLGFLPSYLFPSHLSTSLQLASSVCSNTSRAGEVTTTWSSWFYLRTTLPTRKFWQWVKISLSQASTEWSQTDPLVSYTTVWSALPSQEDSHQLPFVVGPEGISLSFGWLKCICIFLSHPVTFRKCCQTR